MRVITEDRVRKFVASNCANCKAREDCPETEDGALPYSVCGADRDYRIVLLTWKEPPEFCPLLSGPILLEVRAGGSTQPVEAERVQ